MRIRDVVVLVALAACAHNPDPRKRTFDGAQRDGLGGWIVLQSKNGPLLEGELIDARIDGATILTRGPRPQLVFAPIDDIASASVWPSPDNSPIINWGVLGTLSAATHGVWFVFSGPIWISMTAAMDYVETRDAVVEYPGAPWFSLVKWARFPQGMPPGATTADLVPGLRPPAPMTAADALAAATRFAAEHSIALDPQTLLRPFFDEAAQRWVFTWQQLPPVTIVVPASGPVSIMPPTAGGS